VAQIDTKNIFVRGAVDSFFHIAVNIGLISVHYYASWEFSLASSYQGQIMQ
jgi:hypothetical protein